MHDFYRLFSHLFCCVPSRRKNDDHTSESLSTLQVTASPLSVPLPHDTIPHGSSESNTEDANALHHIFSSSSSVRGYQTAATTPAYVATTRPSFEREYRFGSNSSTKPLQTPIERLNKHVRSRLSESRLSKASSKRDIQSPDVDLHNIKDSLPLKENTEPPVADGQLTAGCVDILTLRTASQGGYDSDAHTIASPLLRSNAGTIKISPSCVKQALEKFGPAFDSIASLPLPQPGSVDGHLSPTEDSPTHPQTQSLSILTTPSKSTATPALHIRATESTTDALQRLNVGIGNDTIKAPRTPELRAMTLPRTKAINSHWRLTAPERTSSLNQLDKDLRAKMKGLSVMVESAKGGSMLQANDIDQRSSLRDGPDPALIDYMSKYAHRVSSEETHDDGVNDREADHCTGPVQLQEHGDPPLFPEAKTMGDSKSEIQSPTETDADSIHLFNMRISQRLASQSQMRLQSPNTSNSASTQSLPHKSAVNLPVYGRGSSTNVLRQGVRIAAEHNRRPSDPQTRRLFESDMGTSKSDRHVWKTVTSVHSGSTSFDPNINFSPPRGDEGSSFYFSDGDIGQNQVNSPLSANRRSLLHNPHSLAVAGRSVSARFPGGSVSGSPQAQLVGGNLYRSRPAKDKPKASEDSWLAPRDVGQHQCSVSLPQEGDHIQQTSPTPNPKQLRGNTEDAENISEISLGSVLDRRNERLTEFSAQELQNQRTELLSKINHGLLTVPNVTQASSADARSDGFARLRSASQPNDRSEGKASASESVSSDTVAKSPQENGTYVLGKAFKYARKDSIDAQSDGFLTASRYDRDGRRRHRVRTSASDKGSVVSRSSISGSRRSQSVGATRRSPASPDVDAHQRLFSVAKGPLPRAGPTINHVDADIGRFRSQTERGKSRARKKSILELGRRFASVALPSNDDKNSDTPTRFQDLLGLWAQFPSHTRGDRNGSATKRDGIKARDFLPATAANDATCHPSTMEKSTSYLTPFAGSSTVGRLRPKSSRRLDRARSKSMILHTRTSTLLTSEEKVRRGRKGLLGKWKWLYHGSSSELRNYADARGHRSSCSVGDAPEYPDLECLPGEGLSKPTNIQSKTVLDLIEDLDRPLESSLTAGETTKSPASRVEIIEREPEASDWGRIYRECVGSLSALQSEDGDIKSMTLSDQHDQGLETRGGDVASMELRQSTSDFYRRLSVDQERAREDLLTKAERIGKNDIDEWEDIPVRDDSRDVEADGDDNRVDAERADGRRSSKGGQTPEDSRSSEDPKVPGQFVS